MVYECLYLFVCLSVCMFFGCAHNANVLLVKRKSPRGKCYYSMLNEQKIRSFFFLSLIQKLKQSKICNNDEVETHTQLSFVSTQLSNVCQIIINSTENLFSPWTNSMNETWYINVHAIKSEIDQSRINGMNYGKFGIFL